MARILVADDDIVIRQVLKQHLEEAGYDVLVAQNGEEALKLSQGTSVDLLITDIIMPKKEGLETITEFRRHFPSVKIIAMSGGGTGEADVYLDIAKRLGAQKIFAKPFDLRELLEGVRKLIGE